MVQRPLLKLPEHNCTVYTSSRKANEFFTSDGGPATNNTGHSAHVGSVQRSTFDFDNVLARAAYSDETANQRAQRQQESVSSQLQRIDASLNTQGSRTASNSANAEARSSHNGELRGTGAQFDA